MLLIDITKVTLLHTQPVPSRNELWPGQYGMAHMGVIPFGSRPAFGTEMVSRTRDVTDLGCDRFGTGACGYPKWVTYVLTSLIQLVVGANFQTKFWYCEHWKIVLYKRATDKCAFSGFWYLLLMNFTIYVIQLIKACCSTWCFQGLFQSIFTQPSRGATIH